MEGMSTIAIVVLAAGALLVLGLIVSGKFGT